MVCLAKSSNKLNRVYSRALPLGEELTKAIEEDKITAKMDYKERKKILFEEFEWEPNDALKIWTFGPEQSGPNILVDATKQCQYLTEVRDSIVSAFDSVCQSGVLCDEELRGCRFDIADVNIHSDSAHRGAAQLIPASCRSFKAAQMTAKPQLQEPVFLVEIQAPDVCVGSIYNCVS